MAPASWTLLGISGADAWTPGRLPAALPLPLTLAPGVSPPWIVPTPPIPPPPIINPSTLALAASKTCPAGAPSVATSFAQTIEPPESFRFLPNPDGCISCFKRLGGGSWPSASLRTASRCSSDIITDAHASSTSPCLYTSKYSTSLTDVTWLPVMHSDFPDTTPPVDPIALVHGAPPLTNARMV